jgi:hypothetical protein
MKFSPEKAENLYYFVEECFYKVENEESLSDKESKKLGICYETSFQDDFSAYFAKEELSEDLYYMFDYIICEYQL